MYDRLALARQCVRRIVVESPAVRQLLRNPDDTAQVFVILRAMRGSSAQRAFRRFCASPAGARVMAENRSLLAALDEGRLAALPEGSLGQIYRRFMQAENLSATGLMQSAASVDDDSWPPEAMLFRDRMRVHWPANIYWA